MDRISLAPMMKYSDPHFRHLLRNIHPTMIMYTEMIVDKTVLFCDEKKLDMYLGPSDPFTVVQLASCNKDTFLEAVEKIIKRGFKEINLNSGCPSDKVQHAGVGAILMKTPHIVAEMIALARKKWPDNIFTVKCRIGVDEHDSYEFFRSYIDTIAELNPGMHFIVHARKALLKGLSTKANRTIPPLHYEYVYRISQERPELHFTINGGITTIEDVQTHLNRFRGGIMMGRAVYENPMFLYALTRTLKSECDHFNINNQDIDQMRQQLLQLYADYAHNIFISNTSIYERYLNMITRPVLDLFLGHSFAGLYRKKLHEYFSNQSKGNNSYKNLSVKERFELVQVYMQQLIKHASKNRMND